MSTDPDFLHILKGDCDEDLYLGEAKEDGSVLLTINDPLDGNHVGQASVALSADNLRTLRAEINRRLGEGL